MSDFSHPPGCLMTNDLNDLDDHQKKSHKIS